MSACGTLRPSFLTSLARRHPVLLTAILGFLAFNTATAYLSGYVMILAARFLAGVSAGLAWGILAGYARRMVVDSLKGKALAIAMVGTPIALSIGVPLGSFLGSAAQLLTRRVAAAGPNA